MAKSPNKIDISMGALLRRRRRELGLTMEKVGEKIGVSFQQIQKYENGTNRLGASRLKAIAAVLDVPVSYFFPEEQKQDGLTIGLDVLVLLGKPGALQLLQAYGAIEDPDIQKALLALARSIEVGMPRPATTSAVLDGRLRGG